jgi:hypothetical protein
MPLYSEPELRATVVRYSKWARAGYSPASILEKQATQFSVDDRVFDIFLSHSYADAELVHGLHTDMELRGFSVYVDWKIDKELDRSKVTKKNAEILRQRMQRCKTLVYAYSTKSGTSVWMPWELGYFDALRGRAAILPITPTETNGDKYSGNEYLGLYPYVTKTESKDKNIRLYVNESSDYYVGLEDWIDGKNPSKR